MDKNATMKKHAVIIGSGVGGLATAVRLAALGLKVTVLEANDYVGGKLTVKHLGNYRFDMGPSVFTLPHLIDELTEISGIKQPLSYLTLDRGFNLYFEDGTSIISYTDKQKFINELVTKLGETPDSVEEQLKYVAKLYELTSELFMEQAIHKLSNFLNLKTLKALVHLPTVKLNKTMNDVNAARFKNKKTVQLFNRYAIYNGSNPFKAPALINIIAHLENNLGAFLPTNGMHDITKHLHSLSIQLGAEYKMNSRVTKIIVENGTAVGVVTDKETIMADFVISNSDIKHVYTKLLDKKYYKEKILEQEKSLSALIFYWGIKKEFSNLSLHNMLFASDAEAEFKCMFDDKKTYHDPTIYINITAKYCKNDAPAGCENWFVMVNVPHNTSEQPVEYIAEVRQRVVTKINRMLNTSIENYIEEEYVLDAYGIQQRTSSVGGSLYGNSSNNKFVAFLRHANENSDIKNLYFTGGSVHPGGGIPLSVLSGKIVSEMIAEKL